MRRPPVPCFFIFYQISGSPREVGLQESHTPTILVSAAEAEIQDAFLKNTPSSLPPKLAALLLKVEASLMSAVCQPKPHSSARAREAGSLFVEMLYLGNIYKVLL